MSETDKLKVEMYDDVVKEKNKEYIELTCRFRETCNDIKNKDKEIERLNNIIDKLEKSKEKQKNEYEILILKIKRYLNCYQYFLETQEENNKKIANMIHEFETKDSDSND